MRRKKILVSFYLLFSILLFSQSGNNEFRSTWVITWNWISPDDSMAETQDRIIDILYDHLYCSRFDKAGQHIIILRSNPGDIILDTKIRDLTLLSLLSNRLTCVVLSFMHGLTFLLVQAPSQGPQPTNIQNGYAETVMGYQ